MPSKASKAEAKEKGAKKKGTATVIWEKKAKDGWKVGGVRNCSLSSLYFVFIVCFH